MSETGTLPTLLLRELEGDYAICRLPPDAPVPGWAQGPGLVSVTRAEDELSVVCPDHRVPAGVGAARGWIAARVSNLVDLDTPGVVLAAVEPISRAGLGVFVLSTHLRDYVLVRRSDLAAAQNSWALAGHRFEML